MRKHILLGGILIGLLASPAAVRAADAAVPPIVSAERLFEKDFNKKIVRIRGTVLDVCPDEVDARWMHLVLDSNGTILYVAVREPVDRIWLSGLIGADISALGRNVLGHTGGRLVKNTFYILATNDLSVLTAPAAEKHPATVDFKGYELSVHDQPAHTTRVTADGSVLATWDGSKVLIRTDEDKLVRGELILPNLPRPGTLVRLCGTPETDLYNIILARASWTPLDGSAAAPEPVLSVSSIQIQTTDGGIPRYDFGFHGRAVRLRGTVCGLPVRDGDGRFYIESDGRIVTVDAALIPTAAADLEIGAKVEISGICVMETEKIGYGHLFTHITGYRIVLTAPSGLRVLATPPWWTPVRLLVVILTLLLALASIFVWNATLRRMVNRRSRELLREKLAHVESELRIGERTRLAVELHDALSQNLTGAAMEIGTAEELVGTDDAAARAHLQLASRTLKSSRDELRNCLWDLRSQALEKPDMDAAIRKTLEPYVKDIDLQIRFNVPRAIFTDNAAHALMRIIRELVQNAIRHGHATAIRIAGSRERGELLFSVRDNGCGFDPDLAPGIAQGHFGLQGIRERLRLLGGRLSIESAPGAGTKATARFELQKIVRETFR